ncbi:MBL fold metallo-hydrolase [Almyronema epifaneia]|uniref:MBL fold metallo-hydrolase n=1 Tax=Almyronema epifaneia S1 TaxID=2991925 RepID=A0ABW6IFE8_9CYAN
MKLRQWAIALLLTLATLAGILSLPPRTPAQTSASLTLADAGLSLAKLGDGVYGLIASTDFPTSDPNAAICNGGIVIGSDGVLVVDPFQTEALANLMFATVASLTDQPIRYVVNSHYHFDHSGGNAAAAAMDYPILGRGPIREFMLTRNLEMDPNATAPNLVVNGPTEIWLGDRQVQFTEFDGHSGGTDLIVYVPDVDVLMTGDLLFYQRIPYLGDSNLRVLQSTLAQLATEYTTARILPGHGPVTDRSGLDTFRGYLDDLEAFALSWETQELSQAAAIAQTPLPEQYANYLFQALFPSNLEVAYQQLTLGYNDAAAIKQYFQAQAPALKAL